MSVDTSRIQTSLFIEYYFSKKNGVQGAMPKNVEASP